MKRIMVFWLVLLLPVFVFAKEFESKDINIKFQANDNFIVLTRDNLDNNPDLENLNMTKESMETIMTNNNIYFDIVKNDMSYEILIVVPKAVLSFEDLSKASSEELDELKTTIINETGDNIPIVYKNNYSYIAVNYSDDKGYNNINYYTVMNYHGYNIQLQKDSEITEEDKNELKEIVDSIEFINLNNQENEINNSGKSYRKPIDFKVIIYGAIIGIIAGVITYFICTRFSKKKSSN